LEAFAQSQLEAAQYDARVGATVWQRVGMDLLGTGLEVVAVGSVGVLSGPSRAAAIGTVGVAGTLPRTYNVLPAGQGQLAHIFRNADGHFPVDTPAARQILFDVANNASRRLGVDRFGNEVFALVNPNQTQVWVYVRNGMISNGGLNATPRTWIPGRGLQ
jgi:hypothetical protein